MLKIENEKIVKLIKENKIQRQTFNVVGFVEQINDVKLVGKNDTKLQNLIINSTTEKDLEYDTQNKICINLWGRAVDNINLNEQHLGLLVSVSVAVSGNSYANKDGEEMWSTNLNCLALNIIPIKQGIDTPATPASNQAKEIKAKDLSSDEFVTGLSDKDKKEIEAEEANIVDDLPF